MAANEQYGTAQGRTSRRAYRLRYTKVNQIWFEIEPILVIKRDLAAQIAAGRPADCDCLFGNFKHNGLDSRYNSCERSVGPITPVGGYLYGQP